MQSFNKDFVKVDVTLWKISVLKKFAFFHLETTRDKVFL